VRAFTTRACHSHLSRRCRSKLPQSPDQNLPNTLFDYLSMTSLEFEHDLFGKPLPTFPGHALFLAIGGELLL
jgi:hypothetical protein